MKKYLYSTLLSIGWFFVFMYPFILGRIFCSQPTRLCISPERFAGNSLFEYSFGGHYWLTEQVVYTLDKLAGIHRYFLITKLGLVMIIVFCIALGIATYWLLTRLTAFLKNNPRHK
jgi:hypothetical protein